MFLRFLRQRFRALWDNPFRRVILIVLLSPLATVWFLNDEVVAIYGPAVLAICVLLYLLDPNRDQAAPGDGTEARLRLQFRFDVRSVACLMAFAFVAVVGFFGLVGAMEEGSSPWLFGFGATLLLGIAGIGWVVKRKVSIY